MLLAEPCSELEAAAVIFGAGLEFEKYSKR